ncbi:atypical chemokine receptor 4-like [Pristis pectinata]|uniref:atypical chemokine receptor 4-like n=1 Tax=Pristis pectinata TaxID=685728 RepID=UPI00223D40DD|nr:atypical chemokine receptor 4-like [Pristis pectinata]
MADEDIYDDFSNFYDNGSYHGDRNYSIDYYEFNYLCDKGDVRQFSKYFLPLFYGVTLIAGLSGNFIVVAIYANYKRIKSKTDLYIMNLAIADLLLLVTLPFWMAHAVHGWIFGDVMCKICSALFEMNFCASMLFLACISVDRYLAISRATRPSTVGNRAKIICMCVWLVAIILSTPDFIFSSVMSFDNRQLCNLLFPPQMAKTVRATVQVFDILLVFAIPSLVMLYCYSAVAKVVYKGPDRRKHRALRVLLAVVGLFFLTQLPYNIIKFCRLLDVIHMLIKDCEISKRVDIATQITESIALFHSCLNPILYAFMGASFKGYILKAVKKSSFWRRNQDTTIALESSFNSLSQSEHTSSFSI